MVTYVIAGLPAELLVSCDTYVCGPPAKADAVEEQLRARHPEGTYFHADRFLDKELQQDG